MNGTLDQPPAGGHGHDALRRQMAQDSDWQDRQADQLERRVAAIEAVYAARWPRRQLLAARLGRALRASVRPYGWAGPGFAAQRIQAAGDETGGQR